MGVGSNCIWNTYRYLGIDVIPVPICDGYIGALRVRMWERSENSRLLSGATQKRNPDMPSRSYELRSGPAAALLDFFEGQIVLGGIGAPVVFAGLRRRKDAELGRRKE